MIMFSQYCDLFHIQMSYGEMMDQWDVCVYTYMHVRMYVRTYVHMYVRMYVRMYVHVEHVKMFQ